MSDREFVAGQGGASGGDLSAHIDRFRSQVAAYLVRARARQRRLINLAIVAGAVATVLTASPALGGLAFSDWLNETLRLDVAGMAGAVRWCRAVLPRRRHLDSADEITRR